MDPSPPLAYQPFYCEENVWHLAQRTDLFGPGDHEVVLVIGANAGARVACIAERLEPMVAFILETFGVERCLFGSNFPVDKVGGSWGALRESYQRVLAPYGDEGRRAVLHDNAVRFYRL
jgi:predicted TIM-barrel fold metal-dependent hydrolase